MTRPVFGLLLFSLLALARADKPGQYAAILREFGGPEKFTIENYWPLPDYYKGDECYILVKSAAVYPWDYYARNNNGTRARLKTPVVIGQEVSGVVIACGNNVTHINQADRVFAKMPNYEGGYKQIVLVRANETYRLPENFSHEEGAVCYYPFVTAHKGLYHRAEITKGQSIFIIGGNRDVGRAAIQIAKAYGMHPIIASASSEDAFEDMAKAGATHVINHNETGFHAKAMLINNLKKFDVIFNAAFPKGNRQLDKDFVKESGGHVLYHDLGDIEAETHGWLHGHFTPNEVNKSVHHVLNGFHTGMYRPHINKTFYLDEVAEAHQEVTNPNIVGDMVFTKVHDDRYIHLSVCEHFGNKSVSKPITRIPPVNFSDLPPTLKIGMYRFKSEYNSSAELRSVSQYIYTLACEELYSNNTPEPDYMMSTISFESYDRLYANDSSESNFDASSVSTVLLKDADKSMEVIVNQTTKRRRKRKKRWAIKQNRRQPMIKVIRL